MTEQFSLLRQPWSATPRLLPIALAHCLANTQLGNTARHALLGRLYNTMRPVEQLICMAELRECKAARRGQRLAVVQ